MKRENHEDAANHFTAASLKPETFDVFAVYYYTMKVIDDAAHVQPEIEQLGVKQQSYLKETETHAVEGLDLSLTNSCLENFLMHYIHRMREGSQ